MEQNGQRLSVGSQDDELGDTAVQGLGGLVGTLLQLNDEQTRERRAEGEQRRSVSRLFACAMPSHPYLHLAVHRLLFLFACCLSDLLVVVCLLHEVEDGHGEGGIGQREGLGGGGFVGLAMEVNEANRSQRGAWRDVRNESIVVREERRRGARQGMAAQRRRSAQMPQRRRMPRPRTRRSLCLFVPLLLRSCSARILHTLSADLFAHPSICAFCVPTMMRREGGGADRV